MDPGRYALHQGWDNSALEGYGAVGEPDFRIGVPYRSRRLADSGFPGDPFYTRGGLHRELVERDIFPSAAAVGGWPPSRRSFDEEYALLRESRRHDKPLPLSFHDTDTFRVTDRYRDTYRHTDGYFNSEGYRDYIFDRPSRFGTRDFDSVNEDNYEYRRRSSRHSREDSHEEDHDYGRYSYDSDYERSRKESTWRRRDSRDRERDRRGLSHDRDASPHGRWESSRSRSHSRGRDDRSRSRSPRDRSRGRSLREDSYDSSPYDRTDKKRDRDHDDKKHVDSESVEPSATLVVKGLSQKTTEEDLYQILAEWSPLRHVRVIRERHSGSSRGFAFIDFPTTGAARRLMDSVGDDGIVFDGRKLFFEYSSKPTGSGSAPLENSVKPGHFKSNIQSDWMCTICGCVNFARRTFCFQCNESRSEDAPLADVASSTPVPNGKKGSDGGPTHVLVVRGLDENADEEILRYEFSKHAPVRDIRLVRDKFTHVSRGFAFVHFSSTGDAAKALEATNGSKIEKNGQVIRVAYAKSVHGPASSGNPNSSSLAAAAIEAAAFSQQYDAVGWAPKEYNPDDKQSASAINQNADAENQKTGAAPQSGFVWDEASGYYYDASSGFYYDGNTGLYYDGNTGTWYSYDQQTQQYVPCTSQNDSNTQETAANQTLKTSDDSAKKKVVISAPATVTSKEKASLPDAIQAAAAAALAAEKKEKEKAKETKLASKITLLANKKKMSNVLTMWKQRNHEGQAARVVLDDGEASGSLDDKPSISATSSLGMKNKQKSETSKDIVAGSVFSTSSTIRGTIHGSSSLTTHYDGGNQNSPRLVGNSIGGSVMGVIRSSGKGVVKSDTLYLERDSVSSQGSASVAISTSTSSAITASAPVATPFKTDLAALSSYAPSVPTTSGKRRFSEMPVHGSGTKEQSQTTYRDRAAERRSLYGSSFSAGDEQLEHGVEDSTCEISYRRGSLGTAGMPFPPGVGGGQISSSTQSYEVVTSDRAIDENNVGNRMLRNMGWQEGSGLGKDGSGITEPVLAQGMEERAGLGRHQRKTTDPELEVQAGDSYRTLIQKKAIARFREMA